MSWFYLFGKFVIFKLLIYNLRIISASNLIVIESINCIDYRVNYYYVLRNNHANSVV